MPSSLIIFLSLPPSNDVLKGMVNSTRTTCSLRAPLSHHTMSGRRSVSTICWGKLYEQRSEVADTVGGRYKVMMVAISLKVASCLVLKRRSSHATLQVLRVWIRVCLSPQSGQASLSLFPHNVKFTLCGRVSTALFRANLMCSSPMH